MPALRLPLLGATIVVVFPAFAVAQNSPAPVDPNAPPPGYQQPPPGYQQPPPGYQQPPPGYQQPPPGYQQPPPGYQQPPPGYQQPPPGAYQQPGYYQQPPTGYNPPPGYAPPARPPREKRGFLALPYIGFSTYQSAIDSGLGPGLMLGTLLGGRVGRIFSINGEIRFDFLNAKNVSAGTDVTGLEFELALSPLFHIPLPIGEFVVGPKLGVFGGAQDVTYGGVSAGSMSWSGYGTGVNAGMFFDVSRSVALGGMLSLTVRDMLSRCDMPAGGGESCDTDTNFVSSTVVGFHAGALF